MKPIIFGVFFVILCVAIPSFLGYYFSSNVEQGSSGDRLSQATLDPLEESSEQKEQESPPLNTKDSKPPLVFTREEAIEAVLEQFTLTELLNLYSTVKNGLNDKDKEELLALLEERFSEEEIEALKVFGFSDIEKVLQ